MLQSGVKSFSKRWRLFNALSSYLSLEACWGLCLSLGVALVMPTLADATEAKSPSVVGRIIGGQPAQQAYPWMTSVQARGGIGFEHICGGVLVGPRTVLTAAHCVVDLPLNHVRLVVGRSDISQAPLSEQRSVSEIIVHPGYNRDTFDNDIAVLRMIDAVPNAQPLALPATPAGALSSSQTLDDASGDLVLPGVYSNAEISAPGDVHRILGWGATSSTSSNQSTDQLRAAHLEVFSQRLCINSGSLNQTTFCAGELDGSVDSCLGDSGGPLLRVTPVSIGNPIEQVELMGLVSYGNGTECGQPGVYGFYTDIQKYLAFINGIMIERDLWVPFQWVGLDFPSRAVVPINNYTDQLQLFGVFSGAYPNGVQLQANDCEQAQLAPGQGCTVDYEITPSRLGSQIISTSIDYVTTAVAGGFESAEKRLMGQVAVLPPFDVGTAFTLNNAQWFTGGDGAWGLDVSNYAAGGSSLRSSPLGDNKTSVLQAYMEGPAQLEAYVLVDSEANFDHLVVTINEQERYRNSGYSGWERLVLNIPPEGATVRFEYTKDFSAASGRDAAWVDIIGLTDARDQIVLVDNLDRQLLGGGVSTDNGNQASSGGALATKGLFIMLLLGLGRLRASALGSSKLNGLKNIKGLCVVCLVSVLGIGCAGNNAEATSAKPAAHPAAIEKLGPAGQMQGSQKPGAPSKKEAAVSEPLYSKRFTNNKLLVQVRTMGCTQASSFRIIKAADKPGWYTVERVKADYCRRAPMIMSVTLPVPEAILREIRSSDHPTQMRLTNIEVPSVGLPIIPPAVNP